MCFVSPSGKGLKVLVKTNNYNLEYHKSSYIQVQKYYEELTSLKTDDNNIDAVRLCYFSYDQNAYLNLQAKEFIVEKTEREEVYGKKFEDKITKTINFTNKRAQFKKGNRNKYMFFLATNCCKMGFKKIQVVQYCCSKFVEIDFDTDEITSTINSAYKRNKDSFGVNDKFNRNTPSNKNSLNDLTKQIEELNNTVKTLSNFILKSNKIEEI
ncbi:BT4734/BF3469 family protein [Empedobacter brevis]|uniref:BT4734/BF3469 family protein n=1 Tax=Empedobacter brevis TaxID=247 RepID=UPI00289C62FF|nr:BT4734/BF3469 family protein [Empedobacter brevis]